MEKRQRIAIFLERLRVTSPPRNAEEALALLERTLDEVEDEFSGQSRESNPGLHSERMYPPMQDMIYPQEDGSLLCVSRRHTTTIFPDGSFTIRDVSGRIRLRMKGTQL